MLWARHSRETVALDSSVRISRQSNSPQVAPQYCPSWKESKPHFHPPPMSPTQTQHGHQPILVPVILNPRESQSATLTPLFSHHEEQQIISWIYTSNTSTHCSHGYTNHPSAHNTKDYGWHNLILQQKMSRSSTVF